MAASLPNFPWKPFDAPEMGLLMGEGQPAKAIADILSDPAVKTPVTILINGGWGMGKTTQARLIEHQLAQDATAIQRRSQGRSGARVACVTCSFNAWMFAEGLETPVRTLAIQVAHVARNRLPARRRWFAPLPLHLLPADKQRRRFALRWIFGFGVVATCAAVVYPLLPAPLQSWLVPLDPTTLGIHPIGSSVAILIALVLSLLPDRRTVWTKLISALAGKSQSPESLETLRKDLQDIVQEARPEGGRFVIFMDDVDRLEPVQMRAMLEAIEFLFANPGNEGVAVILLADRDTLAGNLDKMGLVQVTDTHVPQHLRSSVQVFGNPAQGSDTLLSRLIQIQFNLQPLDRQSMRLLFDKLGLRG